MLTNQLTLGQKQLFCQLFGPEKLTIYELRFLKVRSSVPDRTGTDAPAFLKVRSSVPNRTGTDALFLYGPGPGNRHFFLPKWMIAVP